MTDQILSAEDQALLDAENNKGGDTQPDKTLNPEGQVKSEEIVHHGLAVSNEVLSTQVASLMEMIKDQNQTIATLKGTVLGVTATPVTPTIPKELIQRNDKNYRWTLPVFTLPLRGKVTAEEASLDYDIIDEILKIEGQGILVEQH